MSKYCPGSWTTNWDTVSRDPLTDRQKHKNILRRVSKPSLLTGYRVAPKCSKNTRIEML